MQKTTADSSRALPARLAEDPELAALYARIGSRVKELRHAAGMSQRDFCKEVFGGQDRQGEVSRIERGLSMPNLSTLYKIAKYFGVSLAGLGLFEPEDVPAAVEIERAREHLRQALAILE